MDKKEERLGKDCLEASNKLYRQGVRAPEWLVITWSSCLSERIREGGQTWPEGTAR